MSQEQTDYYIQLSLLLKMKAVITLSANSRQEPRFRQQVALCVYYLSESIQFQFMQQQSNNTPSKHEEASPHLSMEHPYIDPQQFISVTEQMQSLSFSTEDAVLRIVHFNDVYDVEEKTQSMGVINFKAKLDSIRQMYPSALLLFSGDCFSPSALSNISHGWQMVHCLNRLNIDAACIGNHEFDYEYKHTLKLLKACKFQWLLGNVTHLQHKHLLGDGLPYTIKNVNGFKVGIIGVVGEDFVGILSDHYQGKLQYHDCVEFTRTTAKMLREKHDCNLIIALSHMRNHSDRNLAANVPEVDLILGGHDHCILKQTVNETLVIKTGCNFHQISFIEVYSQTKQATLPGRRFSFNHTMSKIEHTDKPDLKLKEYIDKLLSQYSNFDSPIGYTEVPLQTRFEVIRRTESNYGNFVTDLFRMYYDCDIAMLNAGTIRTDLMIPVGPLSFSKLSNVFNTPMVIKSLIGKVIWEVLEHSVSCVPEFAGSFLMVSGIKFVYDYKATPRVQSVSYLNQPISLTQEYTVALPSYVARGGDGYDVLRPIPMLLDEISSVAVLTLLLRFFRINSETKQEPSQPHKNNQLKLQRKMSVRVSRILDLCSGYNGEGKDELVCIAPIVDGRIICVTV